MKFDFEVATDNDAHDYLSSVEGEINDILFQRAIEIAIEENSYCVLDKISAVLVTIKHAKQAGEESISLMRSLVKNTLVPVFPVVKEEIFEKPKPKNIISNIYRKLKCW